MDELLSNLFDMTISYPEKVIRSITVYIFLLIAFRIAGKRELGQVSNADLIVILLISNTVQNAIIGNETSLIGGLVGAGVLVLFNKLIVKLGYHFPRFTRALEGEPVTLIAAGKPVREALVREDITIEELLAACRAHGVNSFSDVDSAVLENHGTINVIPRVTGSDRAIVERLDRIEQALQELLQRPGMGLAPHT